MNDYLHQYPAVLDIPTVAEILGVTPATVRKLIKSNDIPCIKVGRLSRITKPSLINYLEGVNYDR